MKYIQLSYVFNALCLVSPKLLLSSLIRVLMYTCFHGFPRAQQERESTDSKIATYERCPQATRNHTMVVSLRYLSHHPHWHTFSSHARKPRDSQRLLEGYKQCREGSNFSTQYPHTSARRRWSVRAFRGYNLVQHQETPSLLAGSPG